MIIINLSGGLGNQIFQYAFGRALSKKLNIELKLDGNYYFSKKCINSDVPRSYLLDKFNIHASLATIEEVKKVNSILKKIVRKVNLKIYGPANPFDFNEKKFNKKDNQFYVGFWQNEKYFSEISEVIRQDITLKNEMTGISSNLMNQITNSIDATSIHVRRTDILDPKNKYGGICDGNYYKKAMDIIKEKVYSPTFFIFSDDIEWCKDNFKFEKKIYFVSNPMTKDYEELVLMSNCKHNIIANSSFSWWGAWLNKNNNKIIIAPRKWLNVNEKEYKDVLPKNWIKI